MNGPAALRPLDEAADSIRRLDEYENVEELTTAVAAVAAAIDRSLRVRLRNDPTAPESDRLSALDPDGLSLDQVVKSLRTRDLISLETAGTVHQVQRAAARAREGTARPADADLSRQAVQRLRRDLGTDPTGDGPPAGGPSEQREDSDGPDGADATGHDAEKTAGMTGRWMAWLAAALAALVVLGAAWVIVRGGNQEYQSAVTAFRAGRLDSAAARFERVRADRGDDVSVLLYLGRVYRRLDRPADAAAVLRQAVVVDEADSDVRRELGHLFMDLGQPRAAVRQYERALEYEPESALNWAALIRALRVLDDPRAEQLLRDAPPEVQAGLGGA